MYLGVDLGTSSIKVLLSDENGNILSSISKNFNLYNLLPNYYEENPDEWYQALVDILLDLNKKYDIKKVKAISFEGYNFSDRNIFTKLGKDLLWRSSSYQVTWVFFTDEELFLADLKDTLPDLTDEEALQILDQEKANENLFNKKVERLRNIYKDKEVQQRQIELAELQAQQEEEIAKAREQFQATLTDLDSIGEFNLEDEDKERIAEFLLGSDKAGNRYFNKALSDPSTLIKMAWFALYGEESLDDYSNYFKERIQEYSEANYKQGYEDALAGKSPKSKKVNKSANPTTSTSKMILFPLSICFSTCDFNVP